MSALNATTYSSTRVSFAMGRDRYLPKAMAMISPKTRTPVVALFASGVLITVVAVALPVKQVAAATCVMFLLVFMQVNLASIFIRRKYADHLRYGYMMPLFPAIPIVAIVVQFGIVLFLFRREPMSLWLTVGWVALGGAIYYLYSRRHELEAKATPVVIEQKAALIETHHRVVIPVANPANVGTLIDLADRLTRHEESTLVLVHVVRIPEQLPYYAADEYVAGGRRVLDEAMRLASTTTSRPCIGLVRLAHHPGRSIVDTVLERKAQTLVMGWVGPKGPRPGVRRSGGFRLGRRRVLIGAEIDHVISRANVDTVVMRGQLPEAPRAILVPVADPRQGRYALSVAEALAADDAHIDLIHVVAGTGEIDEITAELSRDLLGTEEPAGRTRDRNLPVVLHVQRSKNVLRTIIDESAGHDLMIIGAGAETWLKHQVFTPFHYELARRYEGPLVMVKLHSGRAQFASQQAVDFFVSKEPDP